MPAAMDNLRLSPPDRPLRLRPPGRLPPTCSAATAYRLPGPGLGLTLCEPSLMQTMQQQVLLRSGLQEPASIHGLTESAVLLPG
jgi:hypothetical protein